MCLRRTNLGLVFWTSSVRETLKGAAQIYRAQYVASGLIADRTSVLSSVADVVLLVGAEHRFARRSASPSACRGRCSARRGRTAAVLFAVDAGLLVADVVLLVADAVLQRGRPLEGEAVECRT